MSNYPPGVSDSSFGAPWNELEIEREVEVTIKCVISTSVSGPQKLSNEEENEIIESITKSRFEELEIIDGIYNPEIININIL